MPGRIEVPGANVVDIGKRYDIYVVENQSRESAVVVFRNAFFRGSKALEATSRGELWNDFAEIEQSDGSIVFVRKFHLIFFCEAGTKLTCERLERVG